MNAAGQKIRRVVTEGTGGWVDRSWERPDLVPQGWNRTKTKRKNSRRRENEKEKEEGSVFFLLTLLLGSSALHASSPSGQPGGRAGHRRPSSPSPFWSRWRSKQEGCGGARNDVVQRCLKHPLAVTFCTTSEERREKPAEPQPPAERGLGGTPWWLVAVTDGHRRPLRGRRQLKHTRSPNPKQQTTQTTDQHFCRTGARGVPANAPSSGSAVNTRSSEQHRGGLQDKDPFSHAVTL